MHSGRVGCAQWEGGVCTVGGWVFTTLPLCTPPSSLPTLPPPSIFTPHPPSPLPTFPLHSPPSLYILRPTPWFTRPSAACWSFRGPRSPHQSSSGRHAQVRWPSSSSGQPRPSEKYTLFLGGAPTWSYRSKASGLCGCGLWLELSFS